MDTLTKVERSEHMRKVRSTGTTPELAVRSMIDELGVAFSLKGEIATELGFTAIACPADWKKHGKAAGPIRNKTMLEEHTPDLVIAFPLGESRGTHDMIRRARAAGCEVKVNLSK